MHITYLLLVMNKMFFGTNDLIIRNLFWSTNNLSRVREYILLDLLENNEYKMVTICIVAFSKV